MGYELIKDLKNGAKNEKLVVYFLNKHVYKKDIFKFYRNNKKQVDFRNTEIVAELKSRYNTYEKYDETFFGYNKLEYLMNKNDPRKWKFYFLFTDGLYVWSYRENEYRVADFYHKEKGMIKQVYVNIKYLEKITEDINSNTFLPEDCEEFLGVNQMRQ